MSGDQVTVVGGNLSGTVVPSALLANGSLQLNVSSEVRDADEYAWVFKIAYDGSNGTTVGGGGTVSGSVSHNKRSMWSLVLALAFLF